MKVLSGHIVSKTLTEGNMDPLIVLPSQGNQQESSIPVQSGDAEDSTFQPIGNGNNRWRNLFLRMRRGGNLQQDRSAYSSPDPNAPIFGQPLSQICDDGNRLPSPIKEILTLLMKKGPSTEGIFRRACNAKALKETKEQLNSGKEVDLEEKPVILLAALLKDFLRHIPGSLLGLENYQKWMTALEGDIQERFNQLKLVVESLPKANVCLLEHLLCVLTHISKNSETNKMDANNLAVCISPNLLWLENVSLDTADKVKTLTLFLIENCYEIFGENIQTLFGDSDEDDPADILDSLSIHQQDSAYDSTDPDGDWDSEDRLGVPQNDVVKNEQHQLRMAMATCASNGVSRAFSKPFKRRCSEPIIFPSSSAIKAHLGLTRSTDDFSMQKEDLEDQPLKKLNSDDSFLLHSRWTRKSLLFQRDGLNSAAELPRVGSCKGCSYSSSCSLESAFSNVSEDSIFNTSPSNHQRPSHSPLSYLTVSSEEVNEQKSKVKRRTQSMKNKKKETSTGSLTKENSQIENLIPCEELQNDSQNNAQHFLPLTRPRSLSTTEVFQLVDSKKPSMPPSYEQAVCASTDHVAHQSRSITVQNARKLSADRKSRPASMTDGLLNSCHFKILNDCCYQDNRLPDLPAVALPMQAFRQRTMSESISRTRHEKISRRYSQSLFEKVSQAKESYV